MRVGMAVVGMMVVSLAATGRPAAAAWDPEGEKKQLAEAQEAIAAFKAVNPGLDLYFKEAYAYAVFPTVGKGGFLLAGSHGTGLVFEGGNVVGDAKVTEASFGLQAGVQAYSELMFFKDKETFESFKKGDLKLAAQASAAAADKGANAKAPYDNGVAVFVKTKGGLIVDASVGAQKYTFEPKK